MEKKKRVCSFRQVGYWFPAGWAVMMTGGVWTERNRKKGYHELSIQTSGLVMMIGGVWTEWKRKKGYDELFIQTSGQLVSSRLDWLR